MSKRTDVSASRRPIRPIGRSQTRKGTAMQRMLERLDRQLTWVLLAPRASSAATWSRPAVADTRHAELLAQTQRARAEVFGVDDADPNERERSTDAAAWHLIATSPDGEVAGAMRLFVVDRQVEPLTPRDVLAFGHVTFPTMDAEAQHLAALDHLFERAANERIYIYAGGFFTAADWRGSGLGGALGLAAVAVARYHRSRFAASFAAAQPQVLDLFGRMGGKPIVNAEGKALAPFECTRHGFALQLLEFDSMRTDPSMEPGLQVMMRRLMSLEPMADSARVDLAFATATAVTAAQVSHMQAAIL